jgi:signal recognition particle subunit SRP54
MFETLGERLNSALDGVRGSGNLTEDQVKKVTREIRLALLEADVNYAVVKDFVGKVRDRATGAEVSKALSPGQQIVNEERANLMGGTAHKLSFASRPPSVVMLAGLNGHGKTTVAGKLALFVRKLGKNPYLVACDTYRPAAIEQLKQIGRELGVPVYDEGTEAAPEDIAERGVKAARDEGYDFVILDTAGLPGVRGLRRYGPYQARRRRPRGCGALRRLGDGAPDPLRFRGREDERVRLLLP